MKWRLLIFAGLALAATAVIADETTHTKIVQNFTCVGEISSITTEGADRSIGEGRCREHVFFLIKVVYRAKNLKCL
jgi:hypothetical protein